MPRRFICLLFLTLLIAGGCKLFKPLSGDSISVRDDIIALPADSIAFKIDTLITIDTLIISPSDTLIISSSDTLIVSPEITEDIPPVYTFALTGDIMPGTSFPGNRYLPPNDDPWPLIREVAPYIADSFLAAGNLEGPLTDRGELAKKCRDTTTCYAFRIPERYGFMLAEAGFDILSLANNHIGDFGAKGRERTVELLDSLGIASAGLDSSPWTIIEKDSLKIGFTAFSPNKGTPYINDYLYMQELVRFLDDTCDIVIVSFHGGAEGAEYEHVTGEKEFFYGEDRGNVTEFARLAVDSGADIVFGHGPHVTRALEVYKGRFIAYSLGNFLTYRRFNLSGPNGIAPLIKVTVDSSGNFLNALIIPLYQDNFGHVKVDPHKRVINRIRDLIKMDFPGSVIDIDDEGFVKLKTVEQ